MDWAQALSSLLGIGLASGLNVYAVVLTVGLAHRMGWLASLPPGLELLSHTVVLSFAGVLYLAEFIADKVPGFTPFWDGVHTFIRPAGAALLAMGAFGNLDPLPRTLAMLAAGGLALSSHATKMGTRLAAHAVPDPTTHSAISVAEDFSVVGIILLAYSYPWVALPILGAMLVGILFALPFLWRVLRFLVSTLLGRLTSLVPVEGTSREEVILGYVRSGKGLGRLRKAYWNPQVARLRVSGWFGGREMAVRKNVRHVEGVVLDYVECTTDDGMPLSLYLTKDWAARYRAAM